MKVWIDITNTPHVLFFRPIIEELEKKGHKVVITARKHSNTLGMLDLFKMKYTVIGKHAGKSRIKKALYMVGRTFSLVRKTRSLGIDTALCHQSPYAMLAAWLLGIKKRIYVFDNETARLQNMLAAPFCTKAICPEAIKSKKLYGKKLAKYPGVKEAVYLSGFEPNPKVLKDIGLDKKRKILVMRPEPKTAEYYKKETDVLEGIIKDISKKKWQVVVLCREQEQKRQYKKLLEGKIIVPEKEIDGPSLIYYSDLMIGAGGTMNREAAVLGTPVISTYRGKLLAVDKWLMEKGLLIHKEHPSIRDINSAMKKGKRKLLKTSAKNNILRLVLE